MHARFSQTTARGAYFIRRIPPRQVTRSAQACSTAAQCSFATALSATTPRGPGRIMVIRVFPKAMHLGAEFAMREQWASQIALSLSIGFRRENVLFQTHPARP